jgi:hypothetical protein
MSVVCKAAIFSQRSVATCSASVALSALMKSSVGFVEPCARSMIMAGSPKISRRISTK